MAVLAGPVTCPACSRMHSDGPLALSFSTAGIGPALDGVLDGQPAVACASFTAKSVAAMLASRTSGAWFSLVIPARACGQA